VSKLAWLQVGGLLDVGLLKQRCDNWRKALMSTYTRSKGKRWLAAAALSMTFGLTTGAARAQDQSLVTLLDSLL